MRIQPPSVIHVHVGARCLRPRPGIVFHRGRVLDPVDVTSREGLAVTTPARTVIALAASLRPAGLARVVEEARVQRLLSDADLLDALARSPGARGAAALRVLLSRTRPVGLTRSEAERRMLALIAKARLAPPQANRLVCGHEVDLLWPAARLIVEVDGFTFHRTRSAFERDRSRDAVLIASGYRVMRVTWRQLEREPVAVTARRAAALARPLDPKI